MPIYPDDRDRYPSDWQAVRRGVLDRAGHACKCTGECGERALCRLDPPPTQERLP